MLNLKRQCLDLDIILGSIGRKLEGFWKFNRVSNQMAYSVHEIFKQFLDLQLIEKRLTAKEVQQLKTMDPQFVDKLKKYNRYAQDVKFYCDVERREAARVGENKLVMADLGGQSHQKFLDIFNETRALLESLKKIIPQIKS